MSQLHSTDASGQRDIIGEANTIKQALTTDKPLTKANMSFTTLAESAIPNLSCQKILRNRLTISYVPDFFYILERCQLMFISAKLDKTIARIETLNIYSFTLYMAYSLMYAFLANTYENDSSIPEIADVLSFLRNAGFGNNRLPSIVSTWIDAIGKFIDTDTKRHFVPLVPTSVQAGDYFDNYFLSENTAHLLPNFRGLFAMIVLYADPNALNMNRAHMNTNVRLGSDLTAIYPALIGTTQSRRNYAHIPGMKRLAVTQVDNQLPPLLAISLLTAVHPNSYFRYMMLDINVLRYIKEAINPLFENIETFIYTNPSPTGTALVTIPLISENDLNVIKTQVTIPQVAAANNVPVIPAISIEEEYERCTRVKSRTEIVNGFIDYAYQTPVVRIINEDEAVLLGNHHFVSPQHSWYDIEHEFTTPKIYYTETLSLFHKK